MEAGWHADPTGEFEQRYFDGAQWTDHVARAVRPPAAQPETAPLNARVWPALVLAGGALAAVAAFMPWAKLSAGLFSASKDGIDGDGQITALVGVGCALLGFFSIARSVPLTRGGGILSLVFGLVIGGIGVYDFADVSSEGDLIQPASGLYLTIVAGALVIAGAIGALKNRA
ncbi:MAG TPA: DUF2510 domain-containing protein [Acidimicrobiales bacterium]|nr:DUF2510 domain-containing protein [Acidimicrobiales bacterium]